MKTHHVDAFFDYLLSKPNTYYTDVPQGAAVSAFDVGNIGSLKNMAVDESNETESNNQEKDQVQKVRVVYSSSFSHSIGLLTPVSVAHFG